jgi:hypothetical protein
MANPRLRIWIKTVSREIRAAEAGDMVQSQGRCDLLCDEASLWHTKRKQYVYVLWALAQTVFNLTPEDEKVRAKPIRCQPSNWFHELSAFSPELNHVQLLKTTLGIPIGFISDVNPHGPAVGTIN